MFTCIKHHQHETEFKRDNCNRRSGEWRQRKHFECPTRDITTRHISPLPITEDRLDTSDIIPIYRYGNTNNVKKKVVMS